MDRNEVVLVGRLSAAVEEHPVPSGDTATKWRTIVRRRRPDRRGGVVTDSIPCVTFDREAADVVRGLKPRDYIEVTGAFRCRVFGPPGAKIWRHEVEVTAVKAVTAAVPLPSPEDAVVPLPASEGEDPAGMPAALVPRQVSHLAKAM
ncbi:single-strand DNA-binding protein [Nonomuraea polychroma]|uniref:Single-strand DNA-binding protein n=1 Tax=Nonomuraea polychroma TaxID=46176 RepID=A0A438M9J3_9ACTN|nr:single-stranded DNA-binding protein [Nonomuraea polychroma]RVX42295.1 single-strand DNA-binding protein [Nonomuraea polychroma]